MKKYLYVSIFLICFFLISFGIVELFQIPLLSDPSYIQEKGGFFAAIGGILLLISDIILPVPGSLIMIGNGLIFGLYLGTLLSIIGGVSASMIGFWIGRKGHKFLSRFVSEKEQKSAEKMMNKWGVFALIITRPIPLLSETLAIIAGTTASFTYRKMLIGSVLGYLPGAFIYSLVGTSAIGLENTSYSFLLVLGIAGIFWLFGKLLMKKKLEN